jgi:p-aminobenzoyl-glutamate transporter AbgT
MGSRLIPNWVIPILGRHCLAVTLFRIAGVLCGFLDSIFDGFGVSLDVLVGSIVG